MKFTIILPPKAQKRDRIGSRGGHGFSYKDKGQKLEEDKLTTLMLPHRPPKPLEGPLRLWIWAYLPIPLSKPKKWRQEASDRFIRPTTKPDADNLAKMIKDVMTGAFYQDDKQIVELFIGKWYGDLPRWEITLEEA